MERVPRVIRPPRVEAFVGGVFVTSIVFDVHAWPHRRHGGPLVKGINRRGQLCLDVLCRAVDATNSSGDALIVAGDLIDSAGPVQPQFAAALRGVLQKARRPVTLLLGNHDMTAENDHSLAIYEQNDDWTNINVCSSIAWPHGAMLSDCALGCDESILVPFHCDIRDERVRDVPLVVGHFGVYDDSFSPWCKRAKGAWHVDALFAFMRERNIRCVCLGDWHSRAIWQKRDGVVMHHSADTRCLSELTLDRPDSFIVMQGGALCTTGWDNPGLHGYGTVVRWGGERLS